MYANCQKMLFIRMALLKIDFYFEFFKQLKTMFWVNSQEQHSIKTLEFIKTDSYSIASLVKKTYLAVSSSYHQWVDVFMNLLADR